MRGECGVVEGEGEYAMYRPDDMPANCTCCSPSFPHEISTRGAGARAYSRRSGSSWLAARAPTETLGQVAGGGGGCRGEEERGREKARRVESLYACVSTRGDW
jgi:hypothetical protein